MNIFQTAFLVSFCSVMTITAWLLIQRERAALARLQKEHRHLRVRHQHACHLITVLQARLAARDAGPDFGSRWLPRP